MTPIAPDTRLVLGVAAWCAAALAVVALPFLWPAVLALLGGLALVAGWDARLLYQLRPVRLARNLPERAFVGRAARVRLRLEHDNVHAVEVDVVDEVPVDLALPEPAFARIVLPPGAPLTLDYAVHPSARGDRLFGPLIVLVRSPLGLWRARVDGCRGATLRVYPDASRFLRPEALDPRRVFAAIGVRPSTRRGAGMEFESLRDYVPGDDPRRLDWAASARRGRLVTRLYQHERNHTVLVALDTSRLMAGRVGGRTKLDYAVDAALALAYAAMVSGDRVGLAVFDRAVRAYLAPRAHRHELGALMELLRPLQPRLVEPDYRALVRDVAARQRHHALVVVLTDFVEVDAATLTEPLTVLARRHRVLLVAIRDRLYRALDPGRERHGETPEALYRRLVLNDLLVERETALAGLRQRGLQTIDLVPEQITASVLNRYLALRYGPER